MSSPTDHTTYPKSFEARRQLKGLCEEPIDLPISDIFEGFQHVNKIAKLSNNYY
jgi:hypothetical protein